MYNSRSKNSGSALIITMLLVMVVSAIGLGSARLTLSEVNQSRKLEDSTGAYYAAYSGIEQGLLLFRFHHDIQLSDTCKDMVSDPTHCVSPTATSGNPVNFIYDPNDAANPNGTGANYDLKIYYKSNGGVGNFNNLSDSSNPTIKKDDVKQLSNFDGVSPNGFAIKYQLQNITCSNNPADFSNGVIPQNCQDRINNANTTHTKLITHGVEFKIMNFNADGSADTNNSYSCFVDQDYDLRATRSNGLMLSDIKYLPGCKENNILNSNTFNKNTIMQIIPYDTDIQYSIKATDSGDKPQNIDSGTTTIESTGYYGSTKRKLQVQVDRQTGTLLRTFDFVLYSGEDSINP